MKSIIFKIFLLLIFLSGCSSKKTELTDETVVSDEDSTYAVSDEQSGDEDEAADIVDEYVDDPDDSNDRPDESDIDEEADNEISDDEEPVICTDIGCDGYPDIVFANTEDENSTNINSYVYLGSAEGYTVERRIEIPTIGAMGVHVADVNKDGFLDIAFASVKQKLPGESKENRYSTSLLYYGTKEGFDLENRVEFPTIGCSDITLVDLDRDGWVDLLAPNRYNGDGMSGSGYKINSYVYWGSETGFDVNDRLELPTVGAAKARVADLNNDGINDIVFPNGVQEYVGVFESYIYWGTENSKNGWSVNNRTTLQSVSPETATIDDINDDGFFDIFISGWLCLTKCSLKNRIYWGSATGYSNDRYTKIDGVDGVTDAIFIDLDGDGNKDLVLASGAVDLMSQEFSKTSFVMWGELSGNADKFKWSDKKMLELPATASSEAGVADLNGDGYLDIVFASHYPPTEESPEVSQIYWGSALGFDPLNVTELPTQNAAGMKIIGTFKN